MKFSLSWLKEHLDTDETLERLVEKLTMVGLEVENVEDKAKALAPFTIAYVVSAVQHPNADRLRVCMVDTGAGEPVQVVCGAPNARAGMKSVFSPPGTYIPGKDITLGIGNIRGVDPAFMQPGLDLATKLVLELCGGEASQPIIEGKGLPEDRVIDFPVGEIKRLTGLDVTLVEAKRILSLLGFFVAGSGTTVKVAVPSWRADVHGKADIVEEIMRIVGVDRVPMTPFPRGDVARKPVLTPIQSRTRKAKRALAARGLVEAVTWSFISKPQAELFGGGKPELALANPIASELSDMRPSLIPGLIASAQRNTDRGYGDVALFEVGQIFKGDQPQDQYVAASGIRRAMAKSTGAGRYWSNANNNPVDAFDAKGDAMAVLIAAGASPNALQIVPGGAPWLHPGRSGTIQIGPQNILGYFGELHPRALQALGAEGPMVAFEVILERIPEAKAKATRAKPNLDLSAFQPVERDFAFVVPRSVKAGDIVRAAQNIDKKLIVNVGVFDVYEGKGIDPDKKSVGIAVTLQPREKTMTDEEIDAVGKKIVAEVTKRTGGTLRG